MNQLSNVNIEKDKLQIWKDQSLSRRTLVLKFSGERDTSNSTNFL